MSFVGHGWRSGQAGDISGAASTATLASISPTSGARSTPVVLTATGTGFVSGTVLYAGLNPLPTVFVNATTLRCDAFTPMLDSGQAGTINIAVCKPGEVLSGTRPFTAT